jgi:diguanylate cyclase (GGDEF)-like protein/PAS domain S-box-containing protein
MGLQRAVKSLSKVQSPESEVHGPKAILEAIQEPFFILNEAGEFLNANPVGIDLLGYPPEDLPGMVLTDLVALEDLSRVQEGFERIEEEKEIRLDIQIVNRTGEQIPVRLFGIKGESCLLITLRDLSERIRTEKERERREKEVLQKIRERDRYAQELQALRDLYNEKLREIEKMREAAVRLSYIDDLTDIYNHRFFIQHLTLEIERQKRYPNPLSLLMIDIDYFKDYNDTNGHLAGDQALKAIAMLIQHGVRQSDIVARYGGEEFAAILINAGKEGARNIAERVRMNIADTRFPNERFQPNGDLTVSIGVGTFSASLSTLTDLIREADKALYRAKRAGRNRVEG